ncbi:hypothetical protein IEN85_16780 [Pelagicoccus sp. NFK12]|uniref:Uncharacterized protein n=1 Tax=Pelagicoccus enzymogenes TaxID=2773457 RepID=A0A927F9V1_9BACT|nr:hypothetical protein [Pelagicoccus enzymogenes]MBD5781157.1 hypothetical protein [Pelagicoccus enzymogenes]MDQ8199862.1 hypothetical protein [Pelagicoccus enzymogenes]
MVHISEAYKPQPAIDPRLQPQAAERQLLEQLWHAGRLQRHLAALERFYREKRDEFMQLLDTTSDNEEIIQIAKYLVAQNGIVDRLAETLDQIKEIESEIWIQGEVGNHDREKIAQEWTLRHARAWREWRIKEYLYAVEHMEAQLAECLQQAS